MTTVTTTQQIVQVTLKDDVVYVVVSGEGPRGPAGGGEGSGDKNFTFNQGTPAAVWKVKHNLAKNPSVTVQDSAKSTMEGDVEYNNANELTITFAAAFSGTAYLN